MKKIKYIIFLLVIMFITNNHVNAYTLKKTPIDNIWYLRKGGGIEAFSAQFMEYEIDGKVTYCIEPGKHITTDEYFEYNEDYELERKVKLIGYYGYGYGNHTTIKHRMATQALIWELINRQFVEYWTKPSGAGEYMTVNPEKQEIMNIVNEHVAMPNFNTDELTIEIGESAIYTDSFNTLSKFKIIDSDIAKIEDNKVIVTPKDIGSYTITLRRNIDSNNRFIIYEGSDKDSQKMAYFGGVDEKVHLKLNVLGGNIIINKINEDNEFISDVTFELYKDNEIIHTFTTSNESYKINNLKYGNYCLKEISTPSDYEKLSEDYCFTLDEKTKEITILNNYIKLEEEVKSITYENNDIDETIIEVPITYLDKNYINYYILLLGLFLIYYEKKYIFNN